MAIAEEDEEEIEDEGRDEFLEVEEVEAFSPVAEDEKAFHVVEGEDSDEGLEVIGTLMEEEDEHKIAAVDPPQRDVVAIAEQEQQQAQQQS